MNTAKKIFILCALIFALVGSVFAYKSVTAQPPMVEFTYQEAEDRLDSLKIEMSEQAQTIEDMRIYLLGYAMEEWVYGSNGLLPDSVQHQEKREAYCQAYSTKMEEIVQHQFTTSWEDSDLGFLRFALDSGHYHASEATQSLIDSVESSYSQAMACLRSHFVSLDESRRVIYAVNNLIGDEYVRANKALLSRLQTVPERLFREHEQAVLNKIHMLDTKYQEDVDTWSNRCSIAWDAIEEFENAGDVYPRRPDVSQLKNLLQDYFQKAKEYY